MLAILGILEGCLYVFAELILEVHFVELFELSELNHSLQLWVVVLIQRLLLNVHDSGKIPESSLFLALIELVKFVLRGQCVLHQLDFKSVDDFKILISN